MRMPAVVYTAAVLSLLGCGPSSSSPSPNVGTTTRAVTVIVAGPGSVSGAGLNGCRTNCSAQVNDGSAVTLTAQPDSGAVFNGWSQPCSGTGACALTVSADTQLTATFAAAPPAGQHNLFVSKNGSGTVRSTPAGLDCGATCVAAFANGTSVSLSPTPDAGFRFAGWGGACNGPGACAVTIGSDATVYATFESLPPPISPDECAGLAPQPPAPPVVVRLSKNASGSCMRGFADGSGNLALPTPEPATDPNAPAASHFAVHFYDPAARALGLYPGIDLALDEQRTGFLATNAASQFAGPYLDWVEPSGRVRREAQLGGSGPAELEDDPTGGAVVATFVGHGRPTLVALAAYDAQANPRWRHDFPPDRVGPRHGVDRAGNTLLLFSMSGAFYGQWFDPAGTAGPLFVAFGASDPLASAQLLLVPRIGSGFFLQTVDPGKDSQPGRWVRQIDALATGFVGPPPWLAAHDFQKMHPARAGTAYAFIDEAGVSSDCTQRIEVVATTGKSCGSAAFNAGAVGVCPTASIDVAYDGTVIQQLAPSAEGHDGAGRQTTCSWQWWPALLR